MHEFDGHGVDTTPEDRDGEIMLENKLSSLYVQNGIESAYDDVSGAALGPKHTKAGRAVEIYYFKTMGVYEKVPRSEHFATKGKVIGTK